MSKYENYDRISATYDQTRRAVGIEMLVDLLRQCGTALQELVILDAGCGTGNYTTALSAHVRSVFACDLSQGMLRRASDKCTRDHASAFLVQCDLGELSFADATFDAVCCNQVVHHLDEPGTNFKTQRRFFGDAHRVLKPNGQLIVNTITHEQLKDGVWWGELIEVAVARMTKRFAPLSVINEQLLSCGFESISTSVPVDAIIQPEGYFDHASLRRKEFRDGDSHFSLLSEDELGEVLARLDDMDGQGTIHEYIERRDALRLRAGQFTFITARKKPSTPTFG